ncbi:MAG: hypothetical protein JXA98_04515 [Methanosarcinaceae archaeon]|nr:hypothetical protein [Methanosarcinaceae archaeon]
MDYLKLYQVPVKDWVLKTTEKMKKNSKQDVSSWNKYWEETYFELDGKKASIACKGCPRKAAYTLWYLGRIKNSGRERINLSIDEVLEKFSKNGTYATLGQELLDNNPNLSKASLFEDIQKEFKKRTNEKPSESDQGGPTLTWILFREGLLQ